MMKHIVVLGSAGVCALFLASLLRAGAPGAAPSPDKVTFAEHIAPLVYKRCAPCHREGEVAPFSLTSYEDARKRASMLASITEKRFMPPWKAVAGYNEFLDENRLTDAEIALIRKWADTGAERGDPAKEPAPPKFSSEWTLGEPDMVVSAGAPYKLGAEGADVYRNFVIRTNFKETVYVRAMDVHPGNKKVVHHVIAFLDANGRARKLEDANKDGQPGYSRAEAESEFCRAVLSADGRLECARALLLRERRSS